MSPVINYDTKLLIMIDMFTQVGSISTMPDRE